MGRITLKVVRPQRGTSMIKTTTHHTPLATLYSIKENSYRTKDGQYEYCAEEIDALIWQKESKRDYLLAEMIYKQQRTIYDR